jgi:hypothetical protein
MAVEVHGVLFGEIFTPDVLDAVRLHITRLMPGGAGYAVYAIITLHALGWVIAAILGLITGALAERYVVETAVAAGIAGYVAPRVWYYAVNGFAGPLSPMAVALATLPMAASCAIILLTARAAHRRVATGGGAAAGGTARR